MMNRNTSSVFAILLICIVCTSNIARAEFSTLELVTNVSTNFNSFISMIGWEFKTNAAIQVTKLGYYDYGRDGLSSSHEVGIFDTAGQGVAVAAMIDAGTVAPIEGPPVTISPPPSSILGAFRYVSVPPTELAPDTNYVIAATTAVSVDFVPVYDHRQNQDILQTASEISLVQGRYLSTGPSGFTYPYNLLPEVDFGPVFQFTVIPEPSTFALAAVGLAGLAAWGWRKGFGVDRC